MTRDQFLTLVQKAGAKYVEEDWDLLLWAPPGLRFRAMDGHCLVAPYRNQGGQSWKPKAYQDLANDLAEGLEPCDCGDCGEEE
jgi:hypothetical protein